MLSQVKFSPTFCSSAALSAATLSGSPFTVTSNVFSIVVSGPPDDEMPPAETAAVSNTVRSAAVRVTFPVRSDNALPATATTRGSDEAQETPDQDFFAPEPSDSLQGSVRLRVTLAALSPEAKPTASMDAFWPSSSATLPSSHGMAPG